MSSEDKKTILLVEDEAIIAIAQKMTLEKYGYNIITANSGEKAVNEFRDNNSIDLILMDIDLGKGLDGTETAATILNEREIPVVFLSSHTEPEIVEKTEKITSYGYVVKNSGITVLDASIKMAFKLFEANKRIVENELKVRKKLEAILEPEGDISTLSLSDIIDSRALQSMMEEFYQLTKIGSSAVLDISGQVLVSAGWQDICTKFHRVNPCSLKNCQESDVILAKGVQAGDFKAYKCRNNMWDMATPIVVGGRHMGNIYMGQFFYDDEVPDYDMFRGQAREWGFDEAEYISAVERVPRFSHEQVNTAMSFYAKLAGMISSLSYSTVKLSRALHQKDITLSQLSVSESKQKAMISNISDVIGIITADSLVKYKSPNIEKFFGWSPEDLIGADTWLTVHPDDLERIKKEFIYLLENENSAKTVEYRYKCKDGSYKPVELTAVNLTNDPVINGVLLNYHDITERKMAEDSLKASEEKFRLLFRNKNMVNTIYEVVLDKNGKPCDYRYLDVNPAFEKLAEMEASELIGKTLLEVFPKTEQYWIEKFEEAYITGLPVNFENYSRELNAYTSINIFSPQKGQLAVTSLDITERKRAQDEIKTKNEELNAALEEMEAANEELIAANEELEKKENDLLREKIFIEALLESIPGYLYVYDDQGNLIRWNKKHEEMTGYSAEELSRMNMSQWFEGDDAARVAAAVEEVFTKGYGEVEAHLLIKGGSKILIHSNGVRLTLDGKTYFTGVGMDVTEQRRAEAEILQQKTLLNNIIESAYDAIFAKDIDGHYRLINEAGARMLGYRPAEVIGRKDSDLLSAETADEFRKTDEYVMSSGRVYEREEKGVIGGKARILLAHKAPWRDNTGKITGIVGLSNDITERKLAELEIKNLLAEKEIILKEVHHRIRNYMNTIYGLITLQADTLKDPSAISALKDSGSRVKSMMRLYEQLYLTESFKDISISDFISPLADEIVSTFPNSKSVRIEKMINDFILDPKMQQPLGIMINEILTNIMKYAFAGRNSGLISIAVKLSGNNASLIIADNGIGMPESVDFNNSSGFGLQLISMLAGQIGGSIRIERSEGTRFVLEFDI